MKKRIFVSLLIFGLWFLSMGMLIQKEFFPFLGSSVRIGPKWEDLALFKEYWMGIYHENQKIGYTHVWAEPLKTLEEGGFQILSTSLLRMSLMGQIRFIQWSNVTTFDPLFQPRQFAFDLNSGPYRIHLWAEKKDQKWLIQIEGGEGTLIRQTIPAENELYPAPIIGSILSLMKWDKKSGLQFKVFDPLTQSISPVSIKVRAVHELDRDHKKTKVFDIQSNFNGIKTEMQLSETGEILREESPLGFVAINEDMKKALSFEAVKIPPDMARAFSIPSNRILKNPRRILYLKVKIDGISLQEMILNSDRQKLLDEKNGPLVITALPPDKTKYSHLPADASKFSPWLEATPFIQSNHPIIAAQAAKIIADEKDDYAKAQKISHWVYAAMIPAYTLSVPSSLDIFFQKRGDCNEYTVLFTALARSVGIPTRMIAGILYLNGSFFYHAWPEVFVGDWIALDPTLNQDIADATHIGFIEGDLKQQLRLMSILNKIRLEILDAKE